MYCKHCGKLIPDDAKFCSFCGGKQETNSSEINSSKTSLIDRIKNLSNKQKIVLMLYIIYSVIVVLIAIEECRGWSSSFHYETFFQITLGYIVLIPLVIGFFYKIRYIIKRNLKKIFYTVLTCWSIFALILTLMQVADHDTEKIYIGFFGFFLTPLLITYIIKKLFE